MAKAQVVARFVTEVAPPQFVATMRRQKVPRSGLDTIVEDDRELQLAYYSDHQATAAAATTASSLKRSSPASARRTGGFMRELSSCFSSDVVHDQAVRRGGWESRHKGHGRRVVYAHQLH